MSCSYDIRCLDCSVDVGFDINHGKDAMVKVLAMRGELTALAKRMAHIRDLWLGGQHHDLPAWICWFAEHGEHRLAVFDEYGREMDQCRDWHICPTCKHSSPCALQEKHAGEHALTVG